MITWTVMVESGLDRRFLFKAESYLKDTYKALIKIFPYNTIHGKVRMFLDLVLSHAWPMYIWTRTAKRKESIYSTCLKQSILDLHPTLSLMLSIEFYFLEGNQICCRIKWPSISMTCSFPIGKGRWLNNICQTTKLIFLINHLPDIRLHL